MSGMVFPALGALGVWLLASGQGRWASRQPMSSARASASRLISSNTPAHLFRRMPGAVAAGALGWIATWSVVGGIIAPTTAAAFGAAMPARVASGRRRRNTAAARHAWPRLLAEIRVLVANRGQSIPTALFAAGAQAPPEMRGAFSEAARMWALSTDFEASLHVLKGALSDPTADAVCETLRAAHQIGGVQLDARLRALSEAAQAETAAREDARAKQAGARFARGFVALVPAFMALIGLGIGRGREAYATPNGQLLVALCVLAVAACWLWAGGMMSIPQRRRVFEQ